MKIRNLTSVFSIFVMAVFVVSNGSVVLAQEPDVPSAGGAVTDAEVEALAVPDEVVVDSEVTAEDLGVKDQNLLPDSPLYFVKEAWREVKHAFTFSDAGDAKLDLQYASEKLIEAQKLTESEDIEFAVANYQEEIEEFGQEMEQMASRGAGEEAIIELQGQAVDVHIEQTLILDNLEDQVSDEGFVIIKDIKEQAAGRVADVLTRFQVDEQKLQDAVVTAATSGDGSSFKDFKALEVLKAVEEKIPEEARQGINRAQENMYRHLEGSLSGVPREEILKKMEGYMKYMPGDETRRLAVLDEMKFKAELPPEVMQHIEVMKAKAVERFNERFKKYDSPEAQEKLFEHLKQGDLAGVRVLDDLKAHSLDAEVKQKIEDHHKEGIAKFREAFAGDERAQNLASRAEELMAQVRENPDPKTFRLLEELRAELGPEQRAFVEQLETAGQDEMKRRFTEEQEKFFTRINSINPEDLAFMGDFQEKFAPEIGGEFSGGFEQVIEFSREGFEDRIRSFEHSEDVEKFQALFEQDAPPEAREEIRKQIPNLQNFVDQKRAEIERQFMEKRDFIQEFRQQEQGPGFNHEDFKPEEYEAKIREEFRKRFEEGGSRSFPSFPGGESQFPERGTTSGPRQIDESLTRPGSGEELPSNVSCSEGLVWVPDPGRPAGGLCAKRIHSCPDGQIADALGACVPAPTIVPPAPTFPTFPAPSFSPESICREKGGTWNGSFCQFGSSTGSGFPTEFKSFDGSFDSSVRGAVESIDVLGLLTAIF